MEVVKYYMHPSGEIQEDGKIKCTYCGAVMPQGSLKTDFPCTVSVAMPFDEEVTISVWNCQASVFVNNILLYDLGITKAEIKQLAELAVRDVEKSGGAINMSGHYPPSAKLCRLATRLYKKHLAQALEIKLNEANEKIAKLTTELDKARDEKWAVKKAVRRYLVATQTDKAFIKALRDNKIFMLIHSSDKSECEKVKAVKAQFPSYYENKEGEDYQDFTGDADLLRAGFVAVEEEHSLL